MDRWTTTTDPWTNGFGAMIQFNSELFTPLHWWGEAWTNGNDLWTHGNVAWANGNHLWANGKEDPWTHGRWEKYISAPHTLALMGRSLAEWEQSLDETILARMGRNLILRPRRALEHKQVGNGPGMGMNAVRMGNSRTWTYDGSLMDLSRPGYTLQHGRFKNARIPCQQNMTKCGTVIHVLAKT